MMLAGTTHFVGTTTDSIFYGRHFYAAGSIQQTVFAYVHAFFMDQLVTNTTHESAKILLYRQLASWLDNYQAKQAKGKCKSIKPVCLA
jgi:hypothetical protein